MNVLLCAPIWSFQQELGEFSSMSTGRYNFGFLCLSGYLKEQGYCVEMLEPSEMTRKAFNRHIREGNFDLIGLPTWSMSILRVYDTVRILKELSPNSKILLGGYHATFFPERTLEECPEADFVIAGEGEKPLLALVNELEKDSPDLTKVPALYYRQEGTIVHNKATSYLTPKELPFPDYASADLDGFQAIAPHFKYQPTYQLLAGRGCPFNCAFCNAVQMHGRSHRMKPVDKLIIELRWLKENMGAKGFSFLDSTFTANRKWTLEFCHAYEREIGLPWACFARADCVDEERVSAMKRSGCWQIGMGLESANDATLRSINKKTTVEDNRQALELLKRHKIRSYASFILGWPGETWEDAMNTIDWALQHRPTLAIFNTPIPLPATELRKLVIAEGAISADMDWREFDSAGILHEGKMYVNPAIGEQRMALLQRKAYLRFYSSPRVVWSFLRSLDTWPQIASLFQFGTTFLRIMASHVKMVLKNSMGRG